MPYTSLAKSTYEYKPDPLRKTLSDHKLAALIRKIKKRNSGNGYWTVTDKLRRAYHLLVNHKRVYRLMREHRVFQSMSRRATCHDNAAMESFFHIMKVEIDYFTHHYETKKQLVKAMKEWIYYYNHERIRHKLKGLTPIEYRNQALSKYC